MLKLSGAERGIDTSAMHDEALAQLIHEEADRLGIPESLSGFTYKCKVAAQVAMARDKDVVEAMMRTSDTDSILPLTVVRVLGAPRPSCLMSERYYGSLGKDAVKTLVYRRTGELLANEHTVAMLAALDDACVPDSDVMEDAEGDGVDVRAFSEQLLRRGTSTALEILNRCGPITYRDHEFAPRGVVYRQGKTLAEYRAEISGSESPAVEMQRRAEMRRQEEEFEQAMRMDALRREQAEAAARKLAARVREMENPAPTPGEVRAIQQAREYKILDSKRAGTMSVRFRLFDGRVFQVQLLPEDLMQDLAADIAERYELSLPLSFAGVPPQKRDTVASFGLQARSTVSVE